MSFISEKKVKSMLNQSHVAGLSVTCLKGLPCGVGETYSWGLSDTSKKTKITPITRFQMASMSKVIATAYAIQFFEERDIPLTTKVNDILTRQKSVFRLESAPECDPEWANQVQIDQLLDHTALDVGYVTGDPLGQPSNCLDLLQGKGGHPTVQVFRKPGETFLFSGGGFILLQYIIEEIGQRSIEKLMRPFLDGMGLSDFRFTREADSPVFARGYYDDGAPVEDGAFTFPALAAGGECTTRSYALFLSHLVNAYHDIEGSGGIKHNTAVLMLHSERCQGSVDFIGAKVGLGIFIAKAGLNRVALHHAANDGFRGLFVCCVSGPNQGEGFVIASNGSDNAMKLNCFVARELLIPWHGLNLGDSVLESDGLNPEDIVSKSLKEMVLCYFQEVLPEMPFRPGIIAKWSEKNVAVDANILHCTDQSFARASNLFSNRRPTFDPNEFGRQGKIMDSWESKRHNPQEKETVIFTLNEPSEFDLIHFSTEFHNGNHCQFTDLRGWDEENQKWVYLLPKTELFAHSSHWFKVSQKLRRIWSKLSVSGYPDGGISRLGLYRSEEIKDLPDSVQKSLKEKGASIEKCQSIIPKGEEKPVLKAEELDQKVVDTRWMCINKAKPVDVSSSEYGGRVLACTDEHYSPAHLILSPETPVGMEDGLESSRSRGNHNEEVVVGLRKLCDVDTLEFDFSYFINNSPRDLDVYGEVDGKWVPMAEKMRVKPWAGNRLRINCKTTRTKKVRLRLFPDGGINRFKVFGVPVSLNNTVD
ncbi:MAG: serine hydrolase [Bdellovibrionota bacterium]|nr:serine hydrolase [Bdellovibrionota bacterium]